MTTSANQRHRPLLRYAIGAFVAVSCLYAWTGTGGVLKQARAQIPDSGYQRKLLLEEAQKTNQHLAEIVQLLKKHTLNVRIQPTDNEAGGPGRG